MQHVLVMVNTSLVSLHAINTVFVNWRFATLNWRSPLSTRERRFQLAIRHFQLSKWRSARARSSGELPLGRGESPVQSGDRQLEWRSPVQSGESPVERGDR